ncbi:MAG: nucleotidyl transferase AbiEii/AbiGii toxin family protein [Actinomycetota bacterium]|nr:nucleotidyl transferase AbiEii/AbiGii toxin family protein [Actinomycetota bacterium]
MLPDWLQEILPGDTAHTWEAIRDVVPGSAYLVGGTALAVHLRHRVSRDLDFFSSAPMDIPRLRAQLENRGHLAVIQIRRDTLNAQFNGTKIQFLEATDQRVLEPMIDTEGLRISAVGDLLAMKLRAISGRGELRDYFDLKKIEELANRPVEEGLGLYLARYQIANPEQALLHTIRALAYLDDVADDPFLPETKQDIHSYWKNRQQQVMPFIDPSRSVAVGLQPTAPHHQSGEKQERTRNSPPHPPIHEPPATLSGPNQSL